LNIQTSTALAVAARTHLRCPACGADALDAGRAELRCRTCDASYPATPDLGHADLTPPPAGSDARKHDIRAWWGDLYRQLYAATDSTFDAESLRRMVADFEDLMRKRRHLAAVEMSLDGLRGLDVLEIGPGGGGHACLFKSRGARVFAVDITPERAVSTARKLTAMPGPGSVVLTGDAESLPFRDGVFDIVYSNGVLHHAADTDACIEDVRRVLKPGGRAIIMLYSRHSAAFWLNIWPRALVNGELFRRPEAEWIGRLTEGRPTDGTTKNPFTRVYSARQMRAAFREFEILSLRKSSFQFDNICVPRMTQFRAWLLRRIGRAPHPGGVLVYGAPYPPETGPELAIGRFAGFSWNIVARKPEAGR
jgi:SAM-dependent methyltransferase